MMRRLLDFWFLLGTTEVAELPFQSRQEFLASPYFRDILTAFKNEQMLNVFFPKECLHGNEESVRQLLRGLPFPVILFTDVVAFWLVGKKLNLDFKMYNLVVFVCEWTDWEEERVHLETMLYYHFMKLYVIPRGFAKNLGEESKTGMQLSFPSKLIQQPGANLTITETCIHFKDEYEEYFLTCQPNATSYVIPDFQKQRNVQGAVLKAWCSVNYTCNRYTFLKLVESLRRSNATVNVWESADGVVNTGKVMDELNNGDVIVELAQEFDHLDVYAHTRVPQFYDSPAFALLVKDLQLMPKEVILILPFTGNVWACLLLSMVLCVFLTAVAVWVLRVNAFKLSLYGSPFLSSLLQQSEPVSPALTRYQSFRLLLCVWSIAALVMATAFKGCLTSLLRNVPLEGHLPEYISLDTTIKQGYRVCVIKNYLGVFHVRYRKESLNRSESLNRLRCLGGSGLTVLNDGRDAFLIRTFRYGRFERYRQELYNKGFVETKGDVLSEFSGPHMRASSAYQDAVARIMRQELRFGLYARVRALDSFKRKLKETVHSRDSRQTEVDLTLTVTDLRPYFIVWAVGVGASTTMLLLEHVYCWVTKHKRAAGRLQRKIRKR